MRTHIFTISIAMLISLSLAGQKRQIHLVHGMDGEYFSMQRHQNYLNLQSSYKNSVLARNYQYNTLSGIIVAGNELRAQMQLNNPTPSDIVIAHSMGGLNVRRSFIDYKNSNNGSNMFGGLVTLGSPHTGALIANNILGGQFETFIINGINTVTKAPLEDPDYVNDKLHEHISSSSNIIVQGLWGTYRLFSYLPIVGRYVREVIGKKVAGMVNTIIDKIINNIDITETAVNYTSSYTTLEHLKEGSSVLNTLNNQTQSQMNIPTIVVAGSENSPAVYRYVSSVFWADKQKKQNNYYYANTGNVDNEVKEMMDDIANYYKKRYQNNIDKYNSFWYNPFGLYNSTYRGRANRWKNGENFLRLGLNNGLLNLMGCYELQLFTEWVCPCEDQDFMCMVKNLDPMDCYEVSYYVSVLRPNDGLIKASVAHGIRHDRAFLDYGVNHDELKDHPAIKTRIDNILTGAYLPFFKVN